MRFIRQPDGSYSYVPDDTTGTVGKEAPKATPAPTAPLLPEPIVEVKPSQEVNQYVEVNGSEDGLPKELVPIITKKGSIKCPICSKGQIPTNYANMIRYFEHLKKIHKYRVIFKETT